MLIWIYYTCWIQVIIGILTIFIVSLVLDPCQDHQCQNLGTCVSLPSGVCSGYTCECPSCFTGLYCEESKSEGGREGGREEGREEGREGEGSGGRREGDGWREGGREVGKEDGRSRGTKILIHVPSQLGFTMDTFNWIALTSIQMGGGKLE